MTDIIILHGADTEKGRLPEFVEKSRNRSPAGASKWVKEAGPIKRDLLWEGETWLAELAETTRTISN